MEIEVVLPMDKIGKKIDIWFQEDGTACHTANTTIQLL